MPRSLALAAITILASACLASAATITLEADGTGDYPTIQDAFDAASPEATVKQGIIDTPEDIALT